MARDFEGQSRFKTLDGLDIRVVLGIVFGDGAPRVEIASVQSPSNIVPIQAIDRAAKVFLLELTDEMRRQAYRSRPFVSDPKEKPAKRLRAARVAK